MCVNFHSRTYTALQYLEHFAAAVRVGGLTPPTKGLYI